MCCNMATLRMLSETKREGCFFLEQEVLLYCLEDRDRIVSFSWISTPSKIIPVPPFSDLHFTGGFTCRMIKLIVDDQNEG